MLAFGLGLIIGHCLESWFLCCCGGICLLILGCCGGELRLYHLCGIGAGASAAGIAVMRRNKEKS